MLRQVVLQHVGFSGSESGRNGRRWWRRRPWWQTVLAGRLLQNRQLLHFFLLMVKNNLCNSPSGLRQQTNTNAKQQNKSFALSILWKNRCRASLADVNKHFYSHRISLVGVGQLKHLGRHRTTINVMIFMIINNICSFFETRPLSMVQCNKGVCHP